MSMVNLAQSESSVPESYEPNPYGYGTCICLTEEQVEKLGLDKNPPSAGSQVGIRAIAVVKRVTSSYDPPREAAEGEDPESIDVALELQITDLEVTPGATGNDAQAATMLYGGSMVFGG